MAPSAQVIPMPRRTNPATARSRAAEHAVAEALRTLREGIRDDLDRRGRELGSPPANPLADVDWLELFDELRHQVARLGASTRSVEIDDFGFEPMAVERVRPLLDFLHDRYFRIQLAGAAHLPLEDPVLFVANRGGLIPYDGLLLAHALERERPGRARPRFLVADDLVTLPFAQSRLAQIGGVRACRENTERLIASGRSVIAFPEGFKGASKVFRERYQLQRFGRGGAIRAAVAGRVPIVPIGIVGPEEAHPVLFKSSVGRRLLGTPTLPVTPTFPHFGLLGLIPFPTQWRVEIGEPIRLEQVEESHSMDAVRVSKLNEELRERIRGLIHRALERRRSVWG